MGIHLLLLSQQRAISNPVVFFIPPESGTIDEGTVDEGDITSVQECGNNAYWTVTETANGINWSFTFKVTGKAKKTKIKGKWAGTNDELLAIQAWNGAEWVSLAFIPEEVVDQEYTVGLANQYTIDGEVRIRVYRSTGVDDKLYLDCIGVYASDEGEPSPTPAGDFLLLENGDYLLLEDGDTINI